MDAFIIHVQPDWALSKGLPVTLQQAFSCFVNSDLRFFNRWVNKLEKSQTSTMTVLSERQLFGDVKIENWEMAGSMETTDRHLCSQGQSEQIE